MKDEKLYYFGLTNETFQPHKGAEVVGYVQRGESQGLIVRYADGQLAFVRCSIEALGGEFLTEEQHTNIGKLATPE